MRPATQPELDAFVAPLNLTEELWRLRDECEASARVIRAMDELGIDTAELRRSRQHALDTLAVLS